MEYVIIMFIEGVILWEKGSDLLYCETIDKWYPLPET